MDEQLFKEPLVPRRGAERGELVDWLCLAGLYSIFMLGNIGIPTVFTWMDRGFWMEAVGLFLGGALAAEVGILGVWMGLSSARWLHRLLGCGLLLGLSPTCLIIGLTWQATGVLPIQVAFVIYALSLGGGCISWLVFAALRARTGWQIRSARAQPDAAVNKQVSIRYLFGATTSTAALIAIVKAAMPSTSLGIGPLPEIALVCSIYVVYSLLLLIPCCWIGLKKPTPYPWILVLMLEIYFLGSLTIRCLTWILGAASFGRAETAFFFAYSLGFVVSTLLAFAVLRRLGFELRTPSQSFA